MLSLHFPFPATENGKNIPNKKSMPLPKNKMIYYIDCGMMMKESEP
jgi:hypothetical protein